MITALSGARSAPASPLRTSPGSREAPYSRHPTSNRPLRTSKPQALDCCESSQLSLAHGVRLPAPSEPARDREAPYSRHPTSNRPLRTSSRRLWTAVSNHSSLWRTECACQPPPNQPGTARLRTRATQQAIIPLRTSSRRLWTAVSHHSSLWRTECACQPSPTQPGTARLRTRPSPHKPSPNPPFSLLTSLQPAKTALATQTHRTSTSAANSSAIRCSPPISPSPV